MSTHTTLHTSGGSPSEPAKPLQWIVRWQYLSVAELWEVIATTELGGAPIEVSGRARELEDARAECQGNQAAIEALAAHGDDAGGAL